MSLTYDDFLCDDCGAAFSVETNIKTTSYIIRRVCGSWENFTGSCPACRSPKIFVDNSELEEV